MELTEILKQPEGFTPPDVTVKIEKVYAYKSGAGENGEWSFQDIQVTGGKLKLKNLMREFPESRVGMTVTIKANSSKQHGLTGLKVAHEKYQNNVYDKLIVTPSAKWVWAEPTNGNGQAPAQTVAQTSAIEQNGHSSDTAYADHVLACAELANLVMGNLAVEDPHAIQACFATICIDTKNRNILLPKPKTLATPSDAPPPEYGDGEAPEPPEDLPSEQGWDDDIPF